MFPACLPIDFSRLSVYLGGAIDQSEINVASRAGCPIQLSSNKKRPESYYQ